MIAVDTTPKVFLLLLAIASLLGGCVVGERPLPGRHLTATECRDLAALRVGGNTTLAEQQVEVGVLRKAGYDPSPFWDDPYYPDDLQNAQRVEDYWFQTECDLSIQ